MGIGGGISLQATTKVLLKKPDTTQFDLKSEHKDELRSSLKFQE